LFQGKELQKLQDAEAYVAVVSDSSVLLQGELDMLTLACEIVVAVVSDSSVLLQECE